MITEFGLKNFKALKDVTIPIGRVTVLIGPNGTGKSSVLQGLTLLRQSRGQSQLVTSGSAIDLGEYEDVVHRRNTASHLTLQLKAALASFEPFSSSSERAAYSYSVEFDNTRSLYRHSISIEGASQEIHASWHRREGAQVNPDLYRFDDDRWANLGGQNLVAQPITIGQLAGSLNETERLNIQTYFNGVAGLLGRTYVVPAVRGFDSTSYPLEAGPAENLFETRSVESQASRVLSTIAYRRELEDAISQFSSKILGVKLRVKLVPGQRVSAEAYNGTRMNVINEGFGANQLMIMLAQLVLAPKDSLLGIEEAEIHLHPQAQAELADIFVELVTVADKQIILTTHSEHLLMGLLTRVADGRLEPSDLRIHFFQKDKGVATVEPLDVDQGGRLKGGMKGFFEANIQEMNSYLEALSARRPD